MTPQRFPPEYARKVERNYVRADIVERWVTDYITAILGQEDDIVTGYCLNMVLGPQSPSIQEIETGLEQFLGKENRAFCLGLWKLCLSFQPAQPEKRTKRKADEVEEEEGWLEGLLGKKAKTAEPEEEEGEDPLLPEGMERAEWDTDFLRRAFGEIE